MRWARILGVVSHPYTEFMVKKAKRKYLDENPVCSVCGIAKNFTGRENDVHHKEPVHVCPEKACDPTNFVTMCRQHHWLIGHFKNWSEWNKEVDKTILLLKSAYEEAKKSWEGKKEV